MALAERVRRCELTAAELATPALQTISYTLEVHGESRHYEMRMAPVSRGEVARLEEKQAELTVSLAEALAELDLARAREEQDRGAGVRRVEAGGRATEVRVLDVNPALRMVVVDAGHFGASNYPAIGRNFIDTLASTGVPTIDPGSTPAVAPGTSQCVRYDPAPTP